MNQTPASFLRAWDTDPGFSSHVAEPRKTSQPEVWEGAGPLSPCWEVDAFCWPEVVLRLEQTNSDSMRRVSQHLVASNRAGLKVLAVTSGERGVGRTTVSMYLARAAAQGGLRVALVDADLQHPSLIDQLQIDAPNSWHQALTERLPLDEIAVHSVQDGVTLFPLNEPLGTGFLDQEHRRLASMIQHLSDEFDLVVLDSCVLSNGSKGMVGYDGSESIHAAIVVIDSELSVRERVTGACDALRSLGIVSVGVVENFRH